MWDNPEIIYLHDIPRWLGIVEYLFPFISIASSLFIFTYLLYRRFWRNIWQKIVFVNVTCGLIFAAARIGMLILVLTRVGGFEGNRDLDAAERDVDKFLFNGCFALKGVELFGTFMGFATNAVMFYNVRRLQLMIATFETTIKNRKKKIPKKLERGNEPVWRFWFWMILLQLGLMAGALSQGSAFLVSSSYCLLEAETESAAFAFGVTAGLALNIPFFIGIFYAILVLKDQSDITIWRKLRKRVAKGLNMMGYISIAFLVSNLGVAWIFPIYSLSTGDLPTIDSENHEVSAVESQKIYLLMANMAMLYNFFAAVTIFYLDRQECNSGNDWEEPFIKNGRLIIPAETLNEAPTPKLHGQQRSFTGVFKERVKYNPEANTSALLLNSGSPSEKIYVSGH